MGEPVEMWGIKDHQGDIDFISLSEQDAWELLYGDCRLNEQLTSTLDQVKSLRKEWGYKAVRVTVQEIQD